MEARIDAAASDAPPGMWTAMQRRAQAARVPLPVVETLHGVDGTASHLVYDEPSRIGIVVDPTDGPGGTRAHLAALVGHLGIDVHFVLETRLRPDHLGAVAHFVQRHGARAVIADGEAAELRGRDLPAEHGFDPRACPFDVLLTDGDELLAGPLRIRAQVRVERACATASYRVGERLLGSERRGADAKRPVSSAAPSSVRTGIARDPASVDRPSA